MRSRLLALLLGSAFLVPAVAAAQDDDPLPDDPPPARRGFPSRLAFGFAGLNGQPVGDFGRAVNTTWGGQADARWFVDHARFLAVRADVVLAGYGRTRSNASLGFFGSGRVTTHNTTGAVQLGLEVAQPTGPIRPYVNATTGGTFHTTATSLDDWDDDWDDSAIEHRRTLTDDWVRSSAIGGGLRFALARQYGTGVTLDLGARRWFTGPVTYATREDVTTIGGNGPRVIGTRRSPTDQWTFTVGLSFSR